MESDAFLKERFDRLRQIIELRNRKVKDMEKQVIACFDQGDLSAIESLMEEKKAIIMTNQQLSLFIEKWEGKSALSDEKICTSV